MGGCSKNAPCNSTPLGGLNTSLYWHTRDMRAHLGVWALQNVALDKLTSLLVDETFHARPPTSTALRQCTPRNDDKNQARLTFFNEACRVYNICAKLCVKLAWKSRHRMIDAAAPPAASRYAMVPESMNFFLPPRVVFSTSLPSRCTTVVFLPTVCNIA
eukprot:SAG31_NODE_258_length_18937_cov_61.688555_4_plen_159_part_00